MPDPNFIILYVDSPPASAAFYADLLGHPPVESSPTFVLFPLASGIMLGLWSRHTAEPAASAAGGGGTRTATGSGCSPRRRREAMGSDRQWRCEPSASPWACSSSPAS